MITHQPPFRYMSGYWNDQYDRVDYTDDMFYREPRRNYYNDSFQRGRECKGLPEANRARHYKLGISQTRDCVDLAVRRNLPWQLRRTRNGS